MANKLSRLINEGARSQGESGYSQCLLRDGEHFSHEKQPCLWRNHAKQHADTYDMEAVLNQNAVMISIITRKWLMCIMHVYCNRGDSLSASCLCYFHPSTDQLQDIDKRSQTTFVDVKLHSFPYRQQTAAVTWHHTEEEPSPPSVLPLIWTITSYGPSCLCTSASREKYTFPFLL